MTDRFAVVGAGQMGNGIAHVCATTGFDVTLIDVSADALAKAKATIDKNLDRQVKKGALDGRPRRRRPWRASRPPPRSTP
jgi:3-hydroxybutyryl-CoA dehydrogenase